MISVLRRRTGLIVASLVALVFIVQVEWIEVSVAIGVLAAMLMVERRPTDRRLLILAIGGGIFAGAEMLVKLSNGPVIVIVLALALIGCRARARELAAFGISLVGSMLAFWLLTGQHLGDLPDFVRNSLQIVSGYQEAMSLYGNSGWYAVIILLGAAVCMAWALAGRYPDRRARIFGGLIAAVVIFAFYKQSVVRIDRPHIATFFALVALLWVAVPPRRGLAAISMAGLAGMAALSIYASGGIPSPGLNVIENLKGFSRETRTAFSTSRQQKAIDFYRGGLEFGYGVPPRLQDELKGKTVSVEPWETSAVWAYGFDWSPTPVFQNYSAYTTDLDELNAETISSDSGPERILRHPGLDPEDPAAGVDGRYLPWDPPAQAVATLCHFRRIDGASNPLGRWQLLARTPDRCGPQLPAGTVQSSFGTTVPVPKPGPREVILVRIEGAEVHGLERLRSLLYRPKERTAVLSDGSYRLIAATSSDGLMLRAGREVPEGRGVFAQVPQTSTIELTGTSGDLRYEFFRMKVRSGRAAHTLTRP